MVWHKVYLSLPRFSMESVVIVNNKNFLTMAKNLTCPKCGGVFTVDEADYAAIVNQVKNETFEFEELN